MTGLTAIAAALAAGLTTVVAKAQDVYASLSPNLYEASRTEILLGYNPAKARIGMTAEEVYYAEKVASAEGEINESEKVASEAVEALAEEESEQQYTTLIDHYAVLHGVSVSLAQAVILVESNYRPYALGKAGEVGLMQIKTATARMMGYAGSATGLFDPETNIKYGIKYLAKSQKLGDGTTCGTILKYNAGHAAKRMNPVSLDYCSKVKRHIALGGEAPQVARTDTKGAEDFSRRLRLSGN